MVRITQASRDDHDSLDAPVISVLLQQFVAVEEPRIEPTHVTI